MAFKINKKVLKRSENEPRANLQRTWSVWFRGSRTIYSVLLPSVMVGIKTIHFTNLAHPQRIPNYLKKRKCRRLRDGDGIGC